MILTGPREPRQGPERGQERVRVEAPLDRVLDQVEGSIGVVGQPGRLGEQEVEAAGFLAE